MGSPRAITVSIPEDDPLWEHLRAVDDRAVARECIAAIARVAAHSWGQAMPAVFAERSTATSNDLVEVTAVTEALGRVQTWADGGPLEPALLGRCWETLQTSEQRRSQGAHYTPPEVALEVVSIAIDVLEARLHAVGGALSAESLPTIWDPSSGGAAFLLAALEQLETRTGAERSALVRACHASDIDKDALDVCDAALQIWSQGNARPHTHHGDALLEQATGWPSTFGLVVGNPPFLGQLMSDTSRGGKRRDQLRAAYKDVSRAYLDEAGLFLAMASRRIEHSGVLALILPASVLGAADAVDLRRNIDGRHCFEALWIGPIQSFDAAVDVVAAVFGPRGAIASEPEQTTVWIDGSSTTVDTPEPQTWAPLLAVADAVPRLTLTHTDGVLGDHAVLTAGFRQHFYGIADAVDEQDPAYARDVAPALVTSGSIDALWCRWGERETRFARKRWQAPVLHLDRIDDDAVRQWFGDRQRPKLLLASQTAILEVIVDPTGSLVPSVPVLVVEPPDHDLLWPLAAVLTSPVASAWMYALAAGTGLSRRSIRVRAKDVAEIPLPAQGSSWEQAAEHARLAQEASSRADVAGYADAMRSLGKAMDLAYGVDGSAGTWWWNRQGASILGRDEAY